MFGVTGSDRLSTQVTPWFLIMPALVIIGIFHLIPIIVSFILSLYDWDMIGRAWFIGADNYRVLWHDRTFWLSLLNTFWYVLGTVPVSIMLALGIAILLNRPLFARGFYRTIFFLPVITSLNAVALVWLWMYHPKYGLLNGLLSIFGSGASQKWLSEPRGLFSLLLDPLLGQANLSLPEYLSGPSLALTSIIIMSIWKNLGYDIVVLLAGLGTIPRELYEAARIDGAGRWSTFRHVTVPMIAPSIYFLLITSTISSFQMFNQVYMMTDPAGGPLKSTTVAVFYLYQKGFVEFEMGYASSLALVIFMIVFSITLVQYQAGVVQRRS